MIFLLSSRINELQKYAPIQWKPLNVERMVWWEGGTFLFLVLSLSLALVVLMYLNLKKSKALTTFFAGLTHELKTPLASIRLQAEVLEEKLAVQNNPSLNLLTHGLIEQTYQLENQMDKILQLSRLERGGKLNLHELDLFRAIKKASKHYEETITIDIQPSKATMAIIAEEFALQVILNNLFSNSIKHSGGNLIRITFSESKKHIHLHYEDNGTFKGDLHLLGQLFYKHNSSRGSGIGLYLSMNLMRIMGGRMSFEHHKNLIFHLIFQKA